jgi:hypothetical protein
MVVDFFYIIRFDFFFNQLLWRPVPVTVSAGEKIYLRTIFLLLIKKRAEICLSRSDGSNEFKLFEIYTYKHSFWDTFYRRIYV